MDVQTECQPVLVRIEMQFVDKLRIAPFETKYERDLVNDVFLSALRRFIEQEVLAQLEAAPEHADRTLRA